MVQVIAVGFRGAVVANDSSVWPSRGKYKVGDEGSVQGDHEV
jgi:hypothetical protein